MAHAQISISNTSPVTENFDGIGTTGTASLPANWKLTAAGAGTSAGWSTGTNVAATTQAASSGAPTSGGRYNWGNGTTTTDRAVGFMTSGSYGSPNAVMAHYVNNTGATIADFTIAFDIERYRINSAAASVTFFTSTDGTTWTAQTAGDSGAFATGTSSYTFTGGTVVGKSVTLTGLGLANGSAFYLKWHFNTTGTNSQGLGLDNVSLTATTSGTDTTPPQLSSTTPVDGAVGVATATPLVLTFDEAVTAGAGSVKLLLDGNPIPVQTYAATTGTLSNGNKTVTFTPSPALTEGAAYHIEIDSTAFVNAVALSYAGIANATDWNFATVAPDTTPPTVTTLSPANAATGVAVDTDLAVTFSEPVVAATGNVKLYAVGNPTPVETFPSSAGAIAGNTVTFNPALDLTAGTSYYVTIDSGAFVDLATVPNPFGGISGSSGWAFATVAPDTTPPARVSTAPVSESISVPRNTTLAITFDEPVIAGATGNFYVYQAGNPAPVQTIAANTASYSGNTATVALASNLTASTNYHVTVDAGSFTDISGNPFGGISGTTAWTFTTELPDTTPPVILSATPAHLSTNVPVNQVLTITYDENVSVGTGSILVKKAPGGEVVANIDVSSATEVSVSGSQVTIAPAAGLPPNQTLFVDVTAGAFKNADNTGTLIYDGSGSWSFTTETLPELTTAGPYTQGFTGFSAAAPNLPIGWTLTGPITTFGTDTVWGSGSGPGLRGGADLLGFQHTSNTGTLVKTLKLVNSTGSAITDLTISYRGRAARLTETRKPAYTVSVAGTAVPLLAYSTNEGDDVLRTASVSGLNIANGAAFTITWSSDRDLTNINSSRQIGLTGVEVKVGSALLPPMVAAVTFDLLTLTATGVSGASEVVADGGSALTARGFVWSADTSSPVLGGPGVINVEDALDTVGAMSFTLSGLTPQTPYHVRSYATNAQGTTYSATQTITTPAQPPVLVTSYSQPFNAFTGTLPSGWSLVSSGNVTNYNGAWTSSSSSGGTYGGVSNPGVLGYQHVTASGTVTTTLTLQNNTGSTLTSLWVSYLGRVERLANTRHPEFSVSVNGTPVPQLAYSTAGGVDETKTHQVTGLNIAQGANVTIQWVSDGNVGTSGSRRRIGIGSVYVGLSAPTSGYAGWASTNANGEGAEVDTDGDGLKNAVEYFMGTSGIVYTINPSVVDVAGVKKIIWPMNQTATGVSYRVLVSENLTQWDPPASGVAVVGTDLVFTLPTTTTKLFVKLEVTVN